MYSCEIINGLVGSCGRERRANKLLLRLLGKEVLENVLEVVENEGKQLVDVARSALTKSVLEQSGGGRKKKKSNNGSSGKSDDLLFMTRALEERMKARAAEDPTTAAAPKDSPAAQQQEDGKQRWFLRDLKPIVTQRMYVTGSLYRKKGPNNVGTINNKKK